MLRGNEEADARCRPARCPALIPARGPDLLKPRGAPCRNPTIRRVASRPLGAMGAPNGMCSARPDSAGGRPRDLRPRQSGRAATDTFVHSGAGSLRGAAGALR